MTEPLRPSLAPDAFWPADAAYVARTDLQTTAMLGYRPLNIDAVTTLLIGLMGHRPAVRHVSGVTDDILRALADAGLPVDSDIRPYATPEEADAQAERLIAEGFRFVSPYPLPAGRWRDAAQVVPPALWHALNAKDRMEEIVPPAHLPRRERMTVEAARARAFGTPVWVKAGGGAVTGWGFAVRQATDADTWHKAVEDIAALPDARDLIVEEHVDVDTSWGVQLGITDAGTVWGGASEQLFGRPGQIAGSLVDPSNPFPDDAIPVAIAVGEAARARGFRGLAGLDIGRTRDRQIVVFDPNFRFTSSTMQVMFTPAAAARSGLPVSISADAATPRPMAEVIALIRGPIADGWFMPTRLLDAALLPAAEGKSRVTGFTLGRDRAEAEAARDRLAALLAA
jgi:hypothetical protein